MKKTAYVFAVAILTLGTFIGCSKDDDSPGPQVTGNMEQAVQGKWSVEKINHNLCRSNNCNSSNYIGLPHDYFEFRADSAFLVSTGKDNKIKKESYKADYAHDGSFTLTNSTWSGKFKIKELKDQKLVLENSFIGLDPQVVFTDFYYLYR